MRSLAAYFVCTIVFSIPGWVAANAQNLDLAWVQGVGGTAADHATSIAVDAAGNTYTTGQFTGTVDFDPGANTYNLTSSGSTDIYISKFDIGGNFIWAKQMGGPSPDGGNAITLDAAGNIYTTGVFQSTADFDPGAGTYNLGSFGLIDIFVSKLDPNGNFIWAKQMGGSANDQGYAIGIDPAGNVCTTGGFSGTADFDPGPGTYNYTVAGNVDLYVSKLDANGNFIWAVQAGGTAGEQGQGLAIDGTGNIYTTGLLGSEFTGADFDPGSGVLLLQGDGAFVYKLNANGSLGWAKALREAAGFNASSAFGMAIDIDGSGNVYTTGHFSGTVDFDPGPGTFNLSTLTNVMSVYVSKLNAAGDFEWTKDFAATTSGWVNVGNSISIGNNGNVYLTGMFNGAMDFDPGPATYNLTPAGSFDAFIATLDNAGALISAKQLGGIGFDRGNSVTADYTGVIYLAGSFNQTADFDPCPASLNKTSAGGYDIFIAKFALPSVSITASSVAICSGASVTFQSSLINAGSAPSFQWQVNGINVGSDAPTYTTNSLNNGDIVKVILISNASCVPATVASSNVITMAVGAGVSPSVAISTPTTAICAGTSATFTAMPVNGGAAPVYQWQVNGFNVGTNSPGYTTNGLANGDKVAVIMTSSAACASPAAPISNTITMTVSPGGPALVSVSTASNTVCSGATVTFTASPTNGGASPAYQWRLNGSNVGTNSAVYVTNTLINGDVITVIMNSSLSCATGSPVTSNAITISVVPPGPASVTIGSTSASICSGTPVTFTATPTNGGAVPGYQWQVNGVNAGTNAPAYTTSTLANGDVVRVVMTSGLNCATGSPAISNSIVMSVTPSVTPSVNVAASSTAVCAGSSVSFVATAINGGSSPAYQWKVNGGNVGTNSPSYTTASLANGDIVTVVMKSSALCASPDTVISDGIIMSVSGPVTPAVNITVPTTRICTGSSVTFTATPVNGGPAPLYQWQVNGVNVGANAATYTSGSLVNGDVIKVLLTSAAACATVNSAASNLITMTVDSSVTPAVSISSYPGTICYGTTVTFTAVPVYGGSSPVYQWKLNGANAGTNSPSFVSSSLANGDSIICLMTSNAACVSAGTVSSGVIAVVIDPAICPTGFFMPTAFTPNNDGKNDLCRPVLLGNVSSYKFSVYNRLGNKIFETTDVRAGWDGKVSGLQTDTNVFVWVCSFRFQGRPIETRKGTVVLIR